MAYKDLTDQEKVFVTTYSATLDSVRAVKEAGYKSKRPKTTAQSLLKREDIRKSIDHQLEQKRDRVHVEERDIIEGLYKEARNYDDGNPNSRITALRELGRLMGLYQRVDEESKRRLEQEKKNTGGPTVVINYGQAPGDSNEKEVLEHVSKEQEQALQELNDESQELDKQRQKYGIKNYSDSEEQN